MLHCTPPKWVGALLRSNCHGNAVMDDLLGALLRSNCRKSGGRSQRPRPTPEFNEATNTARKKSCIDAKQPIGHKCNMKPSFSQHSAAQTLAASNTTVVIGVTHRYAHHHRQVPSYHREPQASYHPLSKVIIGITTSGMTTIGIPSSPSSASLVMSSGIENITLHPTHYVKSSFLEPPSTRPPSA